LTSAVSIEPGGPAAAAVVAPSIHGVLPAARTRWWVEALAIGWLLWVYDAVNNLAPLRLSTALAHSRSILSLEQSLGIDPEHALDSWLAGHHTLGLLLSDYYDNAHFIVTLSLLGWLWWRRADLYRPLRNSLLLVNLLAFVVFWLYPVAPPRMLPGFTDVVSATHAFGSWHTGALASQANELAAMPSLHIAWAVWCAVALWQLTRRAWIRVAATLYPCVTAVAVLSTGNHFVLDILGGLIDITLALLIVKICSPYVRAPRRPFRGMAARKLPFPAKSDNPAYRMSQTCYEVQDQVD
jgi:hypothetical protein